MGRIDPERWVMSDRIDYDDNGELDDVVVNNPISIHIERMDTNQVWLCVYTADYPDGMRFWLTSKGKLEWTLET